ncbi:hypothetical protein GQ85_04060 [Rhodococcus rhodochrous]|nr:hypothetical protein GQ85_04060 [Rhodococcus rhodochrous]
MQVRRTDWSMGNTPPDEARIDRLRIADAPAGDRLDVASAAPIDVKSSNPSPPAVTRILRRPVHSAPVTAIVTILRTTSHLSANRSP